MKLGQTAEKIRRKVFLSTCIIYILESVPSFAEPDSEKVDPALIIPLADRLCCCLPSRWQHKLLWKQHQLVEKEEQEEMKNRPDVCITQKTLTQNAVAPLLIYCQ